MALLALAAAAQRPKPQILDGRFFATSWDTSSRLPQNTVNALVETDDGVIWAATFGGVGRFTGREWQLLDIDAVPGLLDARICALAVGVAGEMWLGSQTGIVGRFVGGRLEATAAIGARPVRSIIARVDGSAICTAGGDVWVVRSGEPPKRRYDQPMVGMHWLRTGADGALWAGGQGIWRLDEKAPLEVAKLVCHDYTRGIDGVSWIAAESGLWRVAADCSIAHVWQQEKVRAVLVTQDGAIWFAAGNRVFRYTVGNDPVVIFDAGE